MQFIELSDIMVSRGGSVNPKKYLDETFELLSIPAYDAGCPDVLSGKEIGSSKKKVESGDVLLSRIVPHIQRVWVVPPKGSYRQIASSEWIVFRTKQFIPEYLRHFLLSKVFHSQFMQTVSGVGGSLLRARPVEVAKIKIPLPPLEEQRRIAAILDKADAIRRKRQRAIELADEFLRSVFLDMFGDPVTNPMGWDEKELQELLLRMESGWSPKCESRQAIEGEIGVLKLGAVTSCKFLASENKFLPQDCTQNSKKFVQNSDILFSRKNTYEHVAAAAIVEDVQPSTLIFPDLMFRFSIDPKQVTKEYLWACFTARGKRKQIQGLASGAAASMPNIPMGKLKEACFPQPPIKLQKEFSRIVLKEKATAEKMNEQFQLAEKMFYSLQQKAFKGEL